MLRLALAVLASVALGGCAGLVSDFSDNLGKAVFNQPDPEIIADALPAYLVFLDSLLEGNPDSAGILTAASDLYAAYGAVFARDPERAKTLTTRALNYAERAACEAIESGCDWPSVPFQDFEQSLVNVKKKNAGVAQTYAIASLAYIRAHSDDWGALARLPHIEALLLKVLPLRPTSEQGALYSYLGILNTLRPPALGGEPETGREYFEQALVLTDGQDLSVKVEYARGYARLLYEQELHDRLLNEVLAADADVDGLTLTNTLAQQDAVMLLESGKDYF